eukprot:763767-Hanusia_phi.AAC.1
MPLRPYNPTPPPNFPDPCHANPPFLLCLPPITQPTNTPPLQHDREHPTQGTDKRYDAWAGLACKSGPTVRCRIQVYHHPRLHSPVVD